jgi:EAL domain-containing protein (putative c-di-GMP-specific phosphodiesterase class I)
VAGCWPRPLESFRKRISPLTRAQFVEDVLKAVEESGIAAQDLQLEITEDWRINTPEVEDTLRRLAGAGISLVIDDFGTGYSSLNYLGRLPFHGLKIDRSFIQSLPEKAGGRNRNIVEATLALSDKMGLEVTAEGVETMEQLDYLRTRGCGLIQGYLFSKPKPAEELLLD